jgi:hypothetical protein
MDSVLYICSASLDELRDWYEIDRGDPAGCEP